MADIPDIDWINTPHTVAAEFERLRARLAEVEAERDDTVRLLNDQAHDLRARLAAAVERLEMFKRVGSMDPVTVDGLTAILRGEGDRPAAGYQLTCAYCGAIYQPGKVNEPHFPSCKYSGADDRPAADHVGIFDGPPLRGDRP